MDLLSTVPLVAFLAVVIAAFWRSRTFGVFALVVAGLPTYVGQSLRGHFGDLTWFISYLQLAVYLHFMLLVFRPALRPVWFRGIVSIPALWFVAASFLALPWAFVASFGLTPWGAWIPFVLGLFGVVQSLFTREETVDFVLDNPTAVPRLTRYPQALTPQPGPDDAGRRPLRIVQITDPHLGPFMSVARLQKICRRAVERDPDLVLITGDIMTMESHDAELVTEGLRPLADLRGRVFACHGNHDHEARLAVAVAYERLGINLLVDDAALVETEAGTVQLLGADFVWRGRDQHLTTLCERFPRRAGAWRVMLLHDPGAFVHVPDAEADLVLSGHTHGGQVGLVSLGLPHTFLSLVSSIPDHGPWAAGHNRLYVHRATGHYGFPIRLGVPAEESLLRVWRS